jgi:ferredoxin
VTPGPFNALGTIGDDVGAAGEQLDVDWIACKGRGLCAELLPERIILDEWGYPLVDGVPVTGELVNDARAAAKACPTRALRMGRRQSRDS